MIWTRYILSEFVKVFLLVFLSLFFLATLIDFSAHMKSFWQEGVSLSSILLYYAAQLSRQGEIFLCTALLLAHIKVLSQSSVRGEITALCTSGIPLRRLTYPLLFVSLGVACLLFINSEYIQPKAQEQLSKFEESFFKDTGKENEVFSIALEDQSRLVYSSFDAASRCFCDLFWIQDPDHILHMERLSPFDRVGRNVSFLTRQGDELVRTNFAESEAFPKMRFESRSLSAATLPLEWQPLSQLRHFLPKKWRCTRDYEALALTLFLQKLTHPILALLVFLAPLPFCLHFERNRRLFMLYALSLAAFLSYIAATQAFAILGKSLVLSPVWAICPLPIAVLLITGVAYAKL